MEQKNLHSENTSCPTKRWFLISGPMFSGKTSKLQELASLIKSRSVAITHNIDNRYAEKAIVSHNKQKIAAYNCSDFEEIKKVYEQETPDVLFIDELQFFPVEIIYQLKTLKFNSHHPTIYFAGLDKDFRRSDFATTAALSDLIPDSHKIKLRALCSCGAFAEFTKLIVSSNISGNIFVGGKSEYSPCCSSCYENQRV